MTEKIEWYQEVLELEPSSKVFFPLAKLLQANNQTNDAIAILRQGLSRHPEFFEARLMLIDLLEKAGERSESLQEVERLGSKLSIYPGFWRAWASVCAEHGQSDAAIALRLLAAFLAGNEISLLDVLEEGLKSIFNQSSPAIVKAPKVVPLAKTSTKISSEQVPSEKAQSLGLLLEKEDIAAPLQPEKAESVVLQPADVVAADTEGDEEPFSLRTKTMATVLIEQGDYQGALDIYEELLAAADSSEKKEEFTAKISELKGKMKSSEPAVKEDVGTSEPLQGKQKLLDALEVLAKRLEVRAGD